MYLFTNQIWQSGKHCLLACVPYHMLECIDRRMLFLKQIIKHARKTSVLFAFGDCLLDCLLACVFYNNFFRSIVFFAVCANWPMRNESNDAIGEKCCLLLLDVTNVTCTHTHQFIVRGSNWMHVHAQCAHSNPLINLLFISSWSFIFKCEQMINPVNY